MGSRSFLNERMKEGYSDPRWFKKRDKVLYRDNFECQICESEEDLHVHHTYYEPDTPVWDYPKKSLVTLCADCHKEVHRLMKEGYDGEEALDILYEEYN